MNTRSPEIGPVLLVHCPLCDGSLPLDAALTALDCPACGVLLDIASDEPAALAAAA
jgi:hypothetical protein